MSKKIIVLLMAAVLSFSIIGCGKNNNATSTVNNEMTNDSKQEDNEVEKDDGSSNEDDKKELNAQSIDGLTLTANSMIEPVKGDRTKDNVADENGEYFADGSNIVKASDYKKIVVNIDIKNDTDKVVKMSKFYWGAELQDGYELNQTINGDEEDVQVQSKSNGKYEFYFTVKNDINADKIKLSYLWIKNEDEFSKLMQDPNVATTSQEEAKEKYKDIFTSIELETDIQN